MYVSFKLQYWANQSTLWAKIHLETNSFANRATVKSKLGSKVFET
jgi:hypothetical protein